MEYALVPISDGSYAKVDVEDFDKVSRYHWHKDNAGYARTNIWGNNRKVAAPRMHRIVLGVTDRKLHVDHINGDKLDNRKANLRVVTASQNLMNRGPQANNASGYKGVYWIKEKRKWRAEIAYSGIRKHLGYFTNVHDAARAYNEAARKYHGQHAYQNEIIETA